MSLFASVAWKEGMFMVPQHFQQAERALNHSLDTRLRGIAPMSWGVQQLAFQEAGIRQGRLELMRCRAVLSDGLVIDIPGADAAPPARTFQLGTDNKPQDVYLTVPARQARMPLLTRDGDRTDVRFVEQELKVPDDYLPERQQAIRVALKNMRLFLGNEPLDGKVVLPLGQLIAGSDGIPLLNPRRPPPLLHFGASTWLEQEVKAIISKADARAQSLATDRKRLTGAAVEFSQGDILSFWYLQSLNTALLALKQMVQVKELHPFMIFQELLRFCGSMATFESSEMSSLTWYDHDNPGPSFDALLRVIRRQLDYLVTLKHEIIPLTKTDAWWQGTIGDAELLSSGTFLLGVIGEPPTQESVNRLMSVMKIADPDSLESLVAKALTGVSFKYVARLPATVPSRADTSYFFLERNSPYWAKIQQAGQLAVYLPSYLGKLQPELIGIRGGTK